eukprot:gnl/TRDRNA2_/TRDRNA2_69664_c0_seq1.p1 gnl/TRDRNA2_/TRDRNA2_69664_c0~~gnl/TRDRNA2_/TRDRNA2_69664_c0_seq1.p1  ORF type:complete len:253 (-),score=38.50 gnl/TRDRNA2_/TRDRNA2_69664_c0_seq1:379-1137(-)
MALDAGVSRRTFGDTAAAPSSMDNSAITQVGVWPSTAANIRSLHSVRRRAVESASNLFSADGNDSDDPLVVVTQRDPHAACQFIKTVNLLGIVTSAFAALVCCTFLAFYTPQCNGCQRPLRSWLFVFSTLQLSQLPTRIVFLRKIQTAERLQESIEASVASFTASPAWHLSKKVSLFTYVWLMIGIVWVINAGECTRCTGLYWLTVIVVSQAAARAVLALRIFAVSFPDYDDLNSFLVPCFIAGGRLQHQSR